MTYLTIGTLDMDAPVGEVRMFKEDLSGCYAEFVRVPDGWLCREVGSSRHTSDVVFGQLLELANAGVAR